jgi:HupE / UreJ protein
MKKKTLHSIFFFILSFIANAHPLPNTVVNLNVQSKNMLMKIQVPLEDFEIAFKHKVTRNQNQLFSQYFSNHIQIKDKESRSWKMEFINYKIQSTEANFVGKYNEIVFWFKFIPNKNSNYKDFTIHYDAILHEISNHQALIYVNSDWENGIHNNSQQIGVIELDVASNTIYPLHISLEKGSNWKGFKSMVVLGMKHISEGTDHLLFLLVLLLSAPLLTDGKKWIGTGNTKYSLIRIIRIATAFTIGHSITLIIGSFGLLNPNTKPVEIIIAISILVTAIHTIKPIFPNKEIYIALAFGLIHGLAFATILTNLNLETNKLILSLLGFNIGIELMQLFAILLVMPWLLLISSYKTYKLVCFFGATIAGIASIAWIIERSTEKSNFISTHLQNSPNYAIYFVIGLAIFSITTKIIKKKGNCDSSII